MHSSAAKRTRNTAKTAFRRPSIDRMNSSRSITIWSMALCPNVCDCATDIAISWTTGFRTSRIPPLDSGPGLPPVLTSVARPRPHSMPGGDGFSLSQTHDARTGHRGAARTACPETAGTSFPFPRPHGPEPCIGRPPLPETNGPIVRRPRTSCRVAPSRKHRAAAVRSPGPGNAPDSGPPVISQRRPQPRRVVFPATPRHPMAAGLYGPEDPAIPFPSPRSPAILKPAQTHTTSSPNGTGLAFENLTDRR